MANGATWNSTGQPNKKIQKSFYSNQKREIYKTFYIFAKKEMSENFLYSRQPFLACSNQLKKFFNSLKGIYSNTKKEITKTFYNLTKIEIFIILYFM